MEDEHLLSQQEVLAEVLKYKRLTQRDLADLLEHQTSAAVNKWLTTNRRMKPESQARVEEELGLPDGFLNRPWHGPKRLKTALAELGGQ